MSSTSAIGYAGRRGRTSGRAAAARFRVATAVRRASTALAGAGRIGWRESSVRVDAPVILPRDLRSADPAFASELEAGQLGLAGQSVVFAPGSPFDAQASRTWQEELHGFGWLRHVSIAGAEAVAPAVVAIADDWIRRFGRSRDAVAWRPGIAGRRLLSWMAHLPQIYVAEEGAAYDRMIASFGDHLARLTLGWSSTADGYERLLAAIARVAGDVCFEGRDRQFVRSARDLSRELDHQILADGSHVSRNADLPVEILLDLLPIYHCARARDLVLPDAVQAAINRMMPHIRFMRLGRAGLARFHGGGVLGVEAVVAVLGHDAKSADARQEGESGGFTALDNGSMRVLVDTAPPPQLPFAGRAHASCLAFELEVDGDAVIANCGVPPLGSAEDPVVARSTASHATLELGEASSASLLASRRLLRLAGDAPLVMTGRITAGVSTVDNVRILEAEHHGYVERHGLVHKRRLELWTADRALSGRDWIGGPNASIVRLVQDLPFAIRFHLAQAVAVVAGPWTDAVDVRLPSGELWRFSVSGAVLSLEESRRFDAGGACSGLQIVLRGTTFGQSDVRWHFAPQRSPVTPMLPISMLT